MYLGRAVAAGVPECGLWSTVEARTRTATVSRALILSYPIYDGPRLCKGHLSLVEAGVVEGDDG